MYHVLKVFPYGNSSRETNKKILKQKQYLTTCSFSRETRLHPNVITLPLKYRSLLYLLSPPDPFNQPKS